MAAAIAASNGVLPLVGWMALSVPTALVRVSLKWTRVALEGCTLLSSDGDSMCIVVTFTIFELRLDATINLVD